jgi:hypothetical protein
MQGRQFGPMYFPTPAERTGSMGPGGPGMTGHGTAGHATTGHGMAEARGGAPMSMPMAQPAGPIQDQSEGDLPSPPPVYQQQGRFQPVRIFPLGPRAARLYTTFSPLVRLPRPTLVAPPAQPTLRYALLFRSLSSRADQSTTSAGWTASHRPVNNGVPRGIPVIGRYHDCLDFETQRVRYYHTRC